MPPAQDDTAPVATTASNERFYVPDDQNLISLVGAYEIPVTVDARGEFVRNLTPVDDLDEPVNVAPETTLPETINASRNFSRDVRVAVARVDQAKAQTGQSLALLLPSVSLRNSNGKETSDPTLDPDKSNKSHNRSDTALTLRQPLVDLPNFFDYRRRGALEEAREDNRRTAHGDAYVASVSAYLGLISTRLQANMAADFEEQLKELQDYIEKRASAGASSAADMARVRARNQAALSSRLEQEAAHAAAGVEYVRLTNQAPRIARIPKLSELGASLLPEALDQAVTLAMDMNPDVAALKSEMKAADLDKSAAKSRFLPRVDIEISDNKSLHAGGDISAAGQRDKRAMLVMNWAIFNGGGDLRYNDERTARHLELKYRLDDQRRRVVQTLSAQYATLTSTRDRINAGYRELKAMAVAAEAMSQRMLAGNQSLLDLLDVYDRFYQARVRLVTLHIQEMNSVAQIVRLVQGGPTEDALTTPSTKPNVLSAGIVKLGKQVPTSAPVTNLAEPPTLLAPIVPRLKSARPTNDMPAAAPTEPSAPEPAAVPAASAPVADTPKVDDPMVPGVPLAAPVPETPSGLPVSQELPSAQTPEEHTSGPVVPAQSPDQPLVPGNPAPAGDPESSPGVLGETEGTTRPLQSVPVVVSVVPAEPPAEAPLSASHEPHLPAPDMPIATQTLRYITTLNTLARIRYPSRLDARDDYRRQVVAANPGLFTGRGPFGAVPIPAGTRLTNPSNLPPVEQQETLL
jgi:adhesin transport system outer membrane protein